MLLIIKGSGSLSNSLKPHVQRLSNRMSYLRRIAAEELASTVARHFGTSDSPFSHVDADHVISGFRSALSVEAAEAGRPLHMLPPHSIVLALRRFLGPMSYERELSEILCAAYGSAHGGPVNAVLLLDQFAHALAPSHMARPALMNKMDLKTTIATWVAERGPPQSSPASPPRLTSGSPLGPTSVGRTPRNSPPGSAAPAVATATYQRQLSASDPGALIPVPQSLFSPVPASAATLRVEAAALSASSSEPLRAAGSALSVLIAQATAAAHDHERALTATSEAALGWQGRAMSAESEAVALTTAQRALHAELAASEREKNAARSRVEVLEQRVLSLEHERAVQALREREAEGRALELQAQIAAKATELRSSQQAHMHEHQQRVAAEEELSRARAHAHAQLEAQAHEQVQFRRQLDEEREASAQAVREANARFQAELDMTRQELTRQLNDERASVAQLRNELRAARLDLESTRNLRARERAEYDAAAQHAAELQRAAVARMESKMAAAASQAALQLERARKELADERALTQEIVTEAKQEAAAAMAQTLEAREDALRWQRAMTPNTTISGL